MSLPPSSDKEFWGDNEINVFDVPEVKPEKDHYLVWQGPYAVCTSCKYQHTVPIDFQKFDIVEGKLVRRKHDVIE